MTRKIILMCVVLLSLGGLAAQTDPPDPPQPQQAFVVEAVLTNVETGQTFVLPVTSRIENVGPDTYEAEHEIAIPQALLRAQVNEKSRYDGTRSALVTIHQNFSETSSGGNRYVSVNYYKGKWEQLDPAVTATKLQLNAACLGDILGGGFCNYNTWSAQYSNPGEDSWYTYTPSWAGDYVVMTQLTHQSGATKVWLKRGLSTWTFTVTVAESD
ncbi:MAG: hypothetical protein DWQ07_22540 [Chloroflexi bacterium]|nr:MAG: hypothetical protein DWQ07_22540 [Chloroflexota bacterium]MBL1193927.1 hypothetical protein [Chloroflexota bacterium]NOH11221.1 hypothetical protein [Chloroflexota bacterium]